MKAWLLKESLERLWTYGYEGATMLRYLQGWIDQLRWQRLEPFQRLAFMLLDHLDGIPYLCALPSNRSLLPASSTLRDTLLFRRGQFARAPCHVSCPAA
jgi:Transposase